jgi:hypothetical protein
VKSLRPPMVATWLLEHFLSDFHNRSLIGDLIEHYTQGRSSAWYWRQVLIAIAVGCWRDIRTHKLLAVRALAVGYQILVLEGRVLFTFMPHLMHKLQFLLPTTQFPGFALLIISSALTYAVSGWVVARFHRPHQAAMVFLFAALMGLLHLRRPWPPEIYRLFLNSFSNPRYLPYLAVEFVGWILVPISIVSGGLWSCRSGRDHSSENPQIAT